jgi:hypothetical protein
MTDNTKITRHVLATDSYSLARDLAQVSGTLRKSYTQGSSLNPMPMASVVSTPISTAPVNNTTTPTPTASLSTRPR